jgi:hypothetical protein
LEAVTSSPIMARIDERIAGARRGGDRHELQHRLCSKTRLHASHFLATRYGEHDVQQIGQVAPAGDPLARHGLALAKVGDEILEAALSLALVWGFRLRA